MDRNQTSSAKTDQAQFTQHLEKATEIVRSWPAWKQAVLGGLTPKDTSCDQDVNPYLGDKNEEK